MTNHDENRSIRLATRFVLALESFVEVRMNPHSFPEVVYKARRNLEDVLEEILGTDDNK